MPVRKLSKQLRASVKAMVLHFGIHNEKELPEADRNILGAIYEEIEKAEEVDLSLKVGKDGKVTLSCNEINYKFNDPTQTKVE